MGKARCTVFRLAVSRREPPLSRPRRSLAALIYRQMQSQSKQQVYTDQDALRWMFQVRVRREAKGMAYGPGVGNKG